MSQEIVELEVSPHTSEAYYANVYIDGSTVVIPYINFGFLEDVVNPRSDRAVFVDFAYVVCLGIKYLKVDSGVLLGRCEEGDREQAADIRFVTLLLSRN